MSFKKPIYLDSEEKFQRIMRDVRDGKLFGRFILFDGCEISSLYYTSLEKLPECLKSHKRSMPLRPGNERYSYDDSGKAYGIKFIFFNLIPIKKRVLDKDFYQFSELEDIRDWDYSRSSNNLSRK